MAKREPQWVESGFVCYCADLDCRFFNERHPATGARLPRPKCPNRPKDASDKRRGVKLWMTNPKRRARSITASQRGFELKVGDDVLFTYLRPEQR